MDKFKKIFEIDVTIQDIGCKLLSVFRLPQYFSDKDVRLRNKELYEKKKSDKCYVFGLGPSLKSVDLRKIDGDSIVTNRYYLFDKERIITPTFYYMNDENFFVGTESNSFCEALDSYPNTSFILGGKYKKQILDLCTDDKNLYFIDSWGGFLKENTKLDLSKLLPIFNNCVCGAIACAIALEYKEIILLGCDFNSFASPKATHCYNEKDDARLWSMSYELFCYSFVAHAHENLMKLAKSKGINILNATKGSLIDAYPRMDSGWLEIQK